MTLDIQFLSMLASAATGIWFGASFDTYKHFIGSPQRFRWTLLLNDILFWLVQALIFFYVLLQVNQGEVRFYLFLALLLGYSIYRSILEDIYQRILHWFIRVCVRLYDIITRIILVLIVNPIKWLLQVILTLSMMILSTLWTVILFIVKIILSPFRWIWLKYVHAFGNPFKAITLYLRKWKIKLKNKWDKWFHDDE
ncbi:spore cortex biosynthesis protein YabQ [Evansella sp. AB-rgal1]|uniref:spore cortex biosynthesis protein YabQ n=1 Tax=Evansella sp. AB-rgal1 TaxID=3242696 RepID=UPI00359CE58F